MSKQKWVPQLDLRYLDRDVILKGGKLCDQHMYAAHKLLGIHFPSLGSLQSTLLSQTQFEPISESVKEGKLNKVMYIYISMIEHIN